MKKGQLLSQPFIYIFALILGALILIYGGKWVYDILVLSDKVEVAKFTDNLESIVSEYSNYDTGASNLIPVKLPKSVKYACVFDPGKDIKCKIKDKMNKIREISCDAIDKTLEFELKTQKKNSNPYTLFFYPKTKIKQVWRHKLPDIKPVNGNPLCYMQGSKIMITSQSGYVTAE